MSTLNWKWHAHTHILIYMGAPYKVKSVWKQNKKCQTFLGHYLLLSIIFFYLLLLTNSAKLNWVGLYYHLKTKMKTQKSLLFRTSCYNWNFSVGQCVAMSRPTINIFHFQDGTLDSQTKPQRRVEVSWDPGRIVNWN